MIISASNTEFFQKGEFTQKIERRHRIPKIEDPEATQTISFDNFFDVSSRELSIVYQKIAIVGTLKGSVLHIQGGKLYFRMPDSPAYNPGCREAATCCLNL